MPASAGSKSNWSAEQFGGARELLEGGDFNAKP